MKNWGDSSKTPRFGFSLFNILTVLSALPRCPRVAGVDARNILPEVTHCKQCYTTG
jgi:hypothetical protein